MRFAIAVLFSTCLWASPPTLFFTDIDSGPSSGGESGNGAYVTIYGRNFGATRGSSTVKLNGVEVATYTRWDDLWMTGDRALEKITVQLGSGVSTGDFVVTVSGVPSNGIPFTVRSGNIYFVTSTGNDANSGLAGSPWRTILHARAAIAAGDIVYLNNVSQTTDDGSGWSTCMRMDLNSGTAGNPKAFLVYPGATATIGSNTACPTGIRSTGTGSNYWTFAGLNLLGGAIALNTYNDHDWRLIGNDLTCPNGNGQAGCLDTGGTGLGHDFKIYGNNLHNVGTNNSPGSVTALYHGYYISDGQYNIDVGWNTFKDVYGGRCIQEHVNGGTNVYSLWIHDNVIHDCQDDGIVLATMLEPGLGAIEVYNNVIYNAGKGPNNAEGTGAWNCLNVQGWDAGAGAAGTIEVYNNTMYACGTFASPPYAGTSSGFTWEDGNVATKNVRLRNNIIQLTTGPNDFRYMNVYQPTTSTCSSGCSRVTGSNNIFFGQGGNPTNNSLTASVNSDPLFTNANSHDFTLQAGSPAATGGVTTSRTRDFNGVSLPQFGAYPIGAFALASGSGGGGGVSIPVNSGVLWSISPNVGTISASGLYTAPSTITVQQNVTVTASSVQDGLKIATAIITLFPPAIPVAVSLSPGSANLATAQAKQFTSTVTGTANAAVTWSLSPQIGAISANGLYTAPASISSQQNITVTATSVADASKSASSTVTLVPVVVVVAPASVSLIAGQTKQFTANVSAIAN